MHYFLKFGPESKEGQIGIEVLREVKPDISRRRVDDEDRSEGEPSYRMVTFSRDSLTKGSPVHVGYECLGIHISHENIHHQTIEDLLSKED